MDINVNHVHIKTKDPVATTKYYVDTRRADQAGDPWPGLQVDLHGL
jgi:hypothetical protein